MNHLPGQRKLLAAKDVPKSTLRHYGCRNETYSTVFDPKRRCDHFYGFDSRASVRSILGIASRG
jgi:hypothetical protein